LQGPQAHISSCGETSANLILFYLLLLAQIGLHFSVFMSKWGLFLNSCHRFSLYKVLQDTNPTQHIFKRVLIVVSAPTPRTPNP
jgi:hypothetical protein